MRKFGIELELVGPRGATDIVEHAARILNDQGVTARTNSHFGRAYAEWQSKPDSSLTPAGRCTEVVSRIMPAREESYEEIRRVVSALDAAGYGVNRTCGLHVHLNVSDLPIRSRLLVALRYYQAREQINAIMPPSRRANAYAQPFSSRELVALDRILLGRENYSAMFERYRATNLAWVNQGRDEARIEFRQAAGTCNADKVIGWVRFLQDLVEEVARRGADADFSRRPVAVVAPTVRTETVTIPGAAPRMRPGSHADIVLTALRERGFFTVENAQQHGIAPHVLRSVISGFRRHGARISTIEMDGNLAYRLGGDSNGNQIAAPATNEQIFVGQTIARDVTILERPSAITNTTPRSTPAALMTYDLLEGLTPLSRAWVEGRRAVFAEDAVETLGTESTGRVGVAR